MKCTHHEFWYRIEEDTSCTTKSSPSMLLIPCWQLLLCSSILFLFSWRLIGLIFLVLYYCLMCLILGFNLWQRDSILEEGKNIKISGEAIISASYFASRMLLPLFSPLETIRNPSNWCKSKRKKNLTKMQ